MELNCAQNTINVDQAKRIIKLHNFRGKNTHTKDLFCVYKYSPLWKRVIAWERSRAASGYGIIWGDADRNKQEEFSAECHSVDCF